MTTIPGLVSIIMPAYNAARFIGEAVGSVLQQTYSSWELLIVEDCSKDQTKQLIEVFVQQDSRVKAIFHAQNQGVIAARNSALAAAQGQYIAFLDSDDVWLPTKLERQLQALKITGNKISYSGYRRIDEHGAVLGEVIPPAKLDYQTLLKGNELGNLTGIYDCQALGKEFFKNFKHEDYVAWLGLLKRTGTAVGLTELLACYRVYSGSLSSNKLKALSWQWRIYRKSEQISLLKSYWLMGHYAIRAVLKRL